ncbi:Ribosomal protein P2 OS=Rhodanobacter lindaniclasticus OX=75310 GN=B1991_10175 PE=4 SV=1 [Rhodanobacter lindaniclasticus]
MSFLNDLLGGHGQTGTGQAAGAGSLIAVAGQLIEKAGGVQGLVGMLQQHGLGGAVQSWVGTGTNQTVSGDQLGQALQNGGLGSLVQEAASKLGVDPSTVLGGLSQVLPHAVDHLTPDGQVPAQGQGQGGGFNLGMLEGLAGKLLG